MKISLAQLKEVVNLIEEDESDGWEAWISLKNWLAQYEAAQQSVQPTPPLALSCECGSLYGVHEKFCPKYKSAGG
jgi:hypothetical protein